MIKNSSLEIEISDDSDTSDLDSSSNLNPGINDTSSDED